jgi:hypothetical protein
MRVAGTPEAQRAWFALRGPFFIAYGLLVAAAFSFHPEGTGGLLWKLIMTISALAALIGSGASWVITGRGGRARIWMVLEALEVTGLRAMVALQGSYGTYVIAADGRVTAGLIHLAFGSLVLGALLNMTWRKNVGAERAH